MDSNKKIAFNSIVIFIRLIIVSLIGVFSSRIVLDALGASDYGLYNVTGGIVTLLNVFNTAMLSTTYRYIAAELGKGTEGNLNKVFNTCFLIHLCFAALIIIMGFFIGTWYIDNYLNVAHDRIPDAHFVFQISLLTIAISTLLIPYQGLITAHEKFHVLALRDIITKLIYFLAIYYFLYSDYNRLRLYACITLGYNIIYNGSFFIYCKKVYKSTTKFKIYKDFKLLKEMISFAFWILFGTCSTIGKSQGSVIIINYFFGTIVNAAYAVAAQVEALIRSFANSICSAAIPQITKSFSGGNVNRSVTLTSYISKYTFILMSMAAFPVLLEMDFLLSLWLKEVPAGAVVFCKLMILSTLFASLGEGIPALIAATGNIRRFQVVFYVFNLLGLPISWVLYKLGYNQFTILIVYCVIGFLNTFIRLYILKYFYSFDISSIVKVSYLKVLIVSLPLLLFYFLYNPTGFSFWGHMLGMIGSEIFLLIIVVVLGLDSREKELLLNYIHNFKIKRIKA